MRGRGRGREDEKRERGEERGMKGKKMWRVIGRQNRKVRESEQRESSGKAILTYFCPSLSFSS